MTEPYIDNWSRVRPFLHHLLAMIELLSCTLLPPTVRQSSFASGKEGKSTDLLDRSREDARVLAALASYSDSTGPLIDAASLPLPKTSHLSLLLLSSVMPFAMPTAMQVNQGGPPSHSSTETAQQSSGEHQAYSNIYGYPRSTPEQSSTSTSQSPYHGQAHGFPSSSTSSWALMDWSDYSRPSEQPTFGTSPSLVAGRPRYAEQARPHLYPAQQLHQQPYKPTSPSSSSSSPSFGPPPPSAASSTSSSAALRGGYQMDTPLLPAPSSSDAHLLPSSYPPAAHSALPYEAYDSYQPHPSSQYHQPPSNPSGWPQQPQRPFGGFVQQPAPPHQPIRTRSDPVADLSFADRRPAPSSSVSAPLPPTTMAVSNPGGSSSLPYTAYISPGPPEHLGHYQKAILRSGSRGDESDSSYTAVNGPSSSSKPGPAAGGSKGSESRGTSRTRVATSQKTVRPYLISRLSEAQAATDSQRRWPLLRLPVTMTSKPGEGSKTVRPSALTRPGRTSTLRRYVLHRPLRCSGRSRLTQSRHPAIRLRFVIRSLRSRSASSEICCSICATS